MASSSIQSDVPEIYKETPIGMRARTRRPFGGDAERLRNPPETEAKSDWRLGFSEAELSRMPLRRREDILLYAEDCGIVKGIDSEFGAEEEEKISKTGE